MSGCLSLTYGSIIFSSPLILYHITIMANKFINKLQQWIFFSHFSVIFKFVLKFSYDNIEIYAQSSIFPLFPLFFSKSSSLLRCAPPFCANIIKNPFTIYTSKYFFFHSWATSSTLNPLQNFYILNQPKITHKLIPNFICLGINL